MSLTVVGTTGTDTEVETTRAERATRHSRGNGYVLSTLSGTMAAALGANAYLAVMQYASQAQRIARIERIRVGYVTISALTAPVLASRRIIALRGTDNMGATLTGGTFVAAPGKKDSTNPASYFDIQRGGVMRVSTTAGLTPSMAIEAETLWTSEAEVRQGAIGVSGLTEMIQPQGDISPFILNPGDAMILQTGSAWGAAGTWQFFLHVEWTETERDR